MIAGLLCFGALLIHLQSTGNVLQYISLNVMYLSYSRWGQPWNHGDYQHTSMGIIWWAAGLVGIMLSRNGKRTVVPSVLIILTAVAFQGHAQHVANSGAIHSYFGYMLMAGGLSRIVEICFVWKEGQFDVISPWQYLPPLVSRDYFVVNVY